jgi:hypothetical protein
MSADQADSGGDQFTTAIDQFRSTAKWIIAAFAAVGASLVAGFQITGVGNLHGWYVWLGFGGLALALASVLLAVFAVARVLLPQQVLLGDLKGQVSDLVERDKTLLKAQAKDLTTLIHDYLEAYEQFPELWDAAKANPNDPSKKQAAEAGTAELLSLEDAVNYLSTLALAEKVRKAFTSMGPRLVLGVAGTAIGVLAFTYAANHQGAKAEAPPHTSKAVGQSPVGVHLRLSRAERELLAPELGRNCAGEKLWGLAIGGRPVALDVVTIPTPRCRSVRVLVVPGAGITVHRSPWPRVARAAWLERKR